MTFITYLKEYALSKGISGDDVIKNIENFGVSKKLQALYNLDLQTESNFGAVLARNIVNLAIEERDQKNEYSRPLRCLLFTQLYTFYLNYNIIEMSLDQIFHHMEHIEWCEDVWNEATSRNWSKEDEDNQITIEPEYSKINELDQFLETISM